jgi:hypothetical protein
MVSLEEGAVLEKSEGIVDGLFLNALEDGLEPTLAAGTSVLQPGIRWTAKPNF